jgi:hypothetical protein
VQTASEALITRRVIETELAWLKAGSGWQAGASQLTAGLCDDHGHNEGGLVLRPVGPDNGGRPIEQGGASRYDEGDFVIDHGQRSASSAADLVVYAGPQNYKLAVSGMRTKMGDLQITALEKAIELAERYLAEARVIAKTNALSCIRYLQAAQAALRGLEDEVDSILLEAKIVARFQWEGRSDLLKRIDEYLNRYRLAPVLGQAIEGIEACYDFARRDEESFFQLRRGDKAAAMDEVLGLLDELTQYLENLGSSMEYSRENYAGPSGIDKLVLLDLEQLLIAGDDARDDEIRQKVIWTVDEHLKGRQRKGLQYADAAEGTIQKLMNAFGVSLPVGAH